MSVKTCRDRVRHPQDLARELVARERAGDAEGMAALYEPNAVLYCGGGQFARGRDEIRAFYTELLEMGRRLDVGNQRVAIVSEDLALTSTRLPDGSVTAEIARRQLDGTWLWVVDQPSIA